MSEPNGAGEPGNERLDRVERALSLMPAYHIQFREEHKLLLSSQVLMQGGLEELRKDMDSLGRQVETMSVKIERTSDRIDTLTADVVALTANVEGMRQNFDHRLKSIEQQ